jgi:PAS domain S-box-containing protein
MISRNEYSDYVIKNIWHDHIRYCISLIVLLFVFAPFVAAQPACAREKAIVQLKWMHDFQYAGYYAALEKGFYSEAGLDITIREGGPTADVEKDVASGRAEFGIGTSALLINRSKGQDFVVLGQVFQHSPAVLLTTRTSRIHSIPEMIGKRFMYSNQLGDIIALLNKFGIKENSINKIPHNGDPRDLINGKADVMLAYRFNESFVLEQSGEPYLTFSPLTAGIDFYGDNFFTTGRLIAERPSFVEAFRKATLRGWKYALDNKAEIATLIAAKYPSGKNLEWLLFEARQMEDLIQPAFVELGYQSPSRWKSIAQTFIDLGMLPKEFDSTPIIYSPKTDKDNGALIITALISVTIITFLTWLAWTFSRLNGKLKHQMEEHKKMAEKLHLSEVQYRLLAENTSDNIWTIDFDGKFTYVSPAIYKIRGFTPAEVMGQSLAEAVAPNSLSISLERIGQIITNARAGLPIDNVRVEVELLRKDGSTVWSEVSLNGVYSSAGTCVAIVGVTRDITERKKAEAELRMLSRAVEQSPVTIVITDVHGTIEFVNPKFTELTGYTSEEAIGLNPRVLNSGQTPPETFVELWSTISTGKTWEGEFHNKTKDGRMFWEHAVISPLLDGNGTAMHYLAVKEDITEKKGLTEQLVAAKEQADGANRAKSEFLANMSHEIRTPMNGVLGMTQLLEMTELTEEQKDYVATLRSSGKNLLSLINDILDLSKIESGKITLEQTEFNLAHSIKDVMMMQSQAAYQKGLKLTSNLSKDIPNVLIGDQLRVKQIIINLIGNALKFTADGGITTTATILEQHADNVLIQIAVRDTGTGISPDALDEIFKPFVQEDGSISRRFGGTGLGLSISRNLAELMGGSITIESTLGVGSCFMVLLPFTIGESTSISQETSIRSKVTLDGPSLRILLVEDDPININFASSLLKKLGHVAIPAVNGRECLATLEQGGEFDLVLMDIQMPIMNGEEAIKEIRRKEIETSKHQPVIALTAYSLRGDKERFLEMGFDGYLSKPLETKEFISEIKRVMALVGESVNDAKEETLG